MTVSERALVFISGRRHGKSYLAKLYEEDMRERGITIRQQEVVYPEDVPPLKFVGKRSFSSFLRLKLNGQELWKKQRIQY